MSAYIGILITMMYTDYVWLYWYLNYYILPYVDIVQLTTFLSTYLQVFQHMNIDQFLINWIIWLNIR